MLWRWLIYSSIDKALVIVVEVIIAVVIIDVVVRAVIVIAVVSNNSCS